VEVEEGGLDPIVVPHILIGVVCTTYQTDGEILDGYSRVEEGEQESGGKGRPGGAPEGHGVGLGARRVEVVFGSLRVFRF
jgi:hypothetical protein